MQQQTVAALAGEWVQEVDGMDNQIKQKWFQKTAAQLYVYTQIQGEQAALVQLFRENHIPMAILKGMAAAVYYPQPELRALGDVDFLVQKDDFQHCQRQ